MRSLCFSCQALAVVALALVAFAWPGPASAADLDRHYDRDPYPRYFGLYEPWSRSEERPPRKGFWFYTEKPARGVNFLVPMWKYRDYVRPEPWTPAWFRYCETRWPSFDPDTGTIRTPDGTRMCF